MVRKLKQRVLMAAALGALFSCGGGAVSYKARPQVPSKVSWYCVKPEIVAADARSICEPSGDECATMRHQIEVRVKRFGTHRGRLSECAPAAEVFCYTGLVDPERSEGSSLASVHAEQEGTWWFDCFAAQNECETDRKRLSDERLRDEKATDDISPCELWQ
jgi:hypothetical protein